MIVALNKGIVFLLEIAMIASFVYFGFQIGSNVYLKGLLATALPLVAILLWGRFAAPKSAHRLAMPYLAIFRVLMFLAAACCLYKCGKTGAAIALAIFSVATQLLSYRYGD